MFCIIAYNSHMSVMVFGPYDDKDTAEEDMGRLERAHPGARYLVTKLDSDYIHSLPNEHTPGYWRTVHGMYEKNSETGEVREKPDYERMSDFPG